MKSRSTYINYKTPTNLNYNKWLNEYSYDISRMYVKFIDIYNSRYNMKIKKTPTTFNIFCRYIYSCSSKYVFKYDKLKIR